MSQDLTSPTERGERSRLRAYTAPLWDTPTALATAVWTRVLPIRRRLAPAVSSVSILGWTVLVLGIAAWWVGSAFGWTELRIIGLCTVLVLVLSSIFTFGRTQLAVSIDVQPVRVVAGSRAGGEVRVVNTSTRRMLPAELVVPVGAEEVRLALPSLAGGADFEQIFVIPTDRRSVVDVGPVRSQRGDPLALYHRSQVWTDKHEVFVHPLTIALSSLGAGLLRDLEGQTSNDPSPSDLAFNTLREYVPGDDRRHIHWRSSAKRQAQDASATFLVRQFLDTRRSHLTILIDARTESYLDPDDLELAISIGGSVTIRAAHDELTTTVVCGGHVSDRGSQKSSLDSLSRAEPDQQALTDLARQAVQIASDTSILLMITGPHTPLAELRRAEMHFPNEVSPSVIIVDPSASRSISMMGRVQMLRVPNLQDLPVMLADRVAA